MAVFRFFESYLVRYVGASAIRDLRNELFTHLEKQPLLYFHPGQSYSSADQVDLDRQIVDALERNQVESVVVERASFMGTHKLLGEFPRLDGWIAD